MSGGNLAIGGSRLKAFNISSTPQVPACKEHDTTMGGNKHSKV